ncbi:MAG: transglutaminase domain-containing protein [Fimbriimonadaceae bacterium]|nr:transglutaminase domain-containing protein [Fimbriimonadaceae bacterium]
MYVWSYSGEGGGAYLFRRAFIFPTDSQSDPDTLDPIMESATKFALLATSAFAVFGALPQIGPRMVEGSESAVQKLTTSASEDLATALSSSPTSSVRDEYSQHLEAAWGARDKADWAGMAANLQNAWRTRFDDNGIERWGEGLYHALTFALLMNGDVEDAYNNAQVCLKATQGTKNLDEWIGARLQLADAAAQYGDFKTSSACIRQLSKYVDRLGPSLDAYRDILDRATNKEFTYSFRYAVEQFPKEFGKGSVPAFLPRNDLPYQRATYEVLGAKSFTKREKGEQVWLEVVPNGREPFYVEGKVTQLAYSFWPDIKALKSAKPINLPSTDPYLGESYGIAFQDDVSKVAQSLRGSSVWESNKRITAWIASNVPYVMDGSDKYIVVGNDAFKHRKGVCNPRALLNVEMNRLAGVPCRVVRGMGSFTTPPGWHTWFEIRSPLKNADGTPRWVPSDVGSTVTDFPKHLGMQFYPSVAPFSERGFEWEIWYPFNIDTVHYSEKKLTLPDTGEVIKRP